MNTKLMMLKAYFGINSIINPEKAAAESFKIFQRVRKKEVREREIPFYQKARQFKVQSEKEPIDCFELGDPNGPLVFLVHGWDSNAGSMTKIAERFEQMGYRVIAFNLPGHAFYKSRSTNLLECKHAFLDVLRFINPADGFSVVSHSFGSAVVANGLAEVDYKADRLVFMTNPDKMEDIFKEFKEIIGLRRKAHRALIRQTSQLLGKPIQTLDVTTNLKKANFKKLLLLHDQHDGVLPHKNAFNINNEIKDAQLITFEHIGHYRMLWNEEVIGRAAAFVEGEEVY